MLTQHYKKWKAVRLKDDKSIAYLSELFRKGWFVMDVGLGELQILAFTFPAEVPDRRDKNIIIRRAKDAELSIVILTKGNARSRQRAVVRETDIPAKSRFIRHIKFGVVSVAAVYKGWRQLAILHAEDGSIVDIYERESAADAESSSG